MSKTRKILHLTLAAILFSNAAITLSGCSKGKSKKEKNPVAPVKTEKLENTGDFAAWKDSAQIRAALEAQDFDMVKKIAVARINARPQDPQAYYFLGKGQLGLGELLNGCRSLEAAVKLQPTNEGYKQALADGQNMLATQAINKGLPNEAIEIYENLLKSGYNTEATEKNIANAYVKTFDSLFQNNKANEGESMLRAAMAKYPEQEGLKIRLADYLMGSDRLMEADRILRGLNNTHPNNAQAIAAYGRLALKIGDLDRANELLVQANRIEPSSEAVQRLAQAIRGQTPTTNLTQTPEQNMSLEELLDVLKVYEKNGSLNDEKRALHTLIDKYPDETWAILDLSILCERLGDLDAATSYAETFLALEAGSQRGKLHYAKCLYQKNHFERALELITEIEGSYPNKLELMTEKGQVLARMGQFEDAKGLWNMVLASDASHSEAIFNLAQLEMELGNHEVSSGLFERAIRQEPFNNKYRYFAGINLLQGQRPTEAHNLWSASVATLNRADPYAQKILNGLGNQEEVQERAVQDQLEPVEIPAYIINETPAPVSYGQGDSANDYQQALALARSGSYGQAIEAFNKLLSHDPHNFNALMNLGKVYTITNRHDRASAIYLKALKLNPTNIHAQKALANSYADVGMHSLAYQITKQVADKTPAQSEGFPVYTKAVTKNDPRAIEPITKAFIEENLTTEAMVIVQSTLNQQPNNNMMNILQGDIYLKMGRLDKAVESYKLAQHNEPQNPLPYIKSGDMLANSGEVKAAAAEYTKALSTTFIDPDSMFDIADRFEKIQYNNSAKTVLNKLKTMNLNNLQLKKLEDRLGESLTVNTASGH